MREDTNSNDLQEIITQAIEEIKNEQGDNFDLQKINLAELSRRTNISRSKLRRLKKNGFEVIFKVDVNGWTKLVAERNI